MMNRGEIQERILTVGNQLGLHARVATMMVQAMSNYSSQVTVIKDGVEVDARSVLGLLLLAATPGSQIVVRAQGPDSVQAIEAICKLVERNETDHN